MVSVPGAEPWSATGHGAHASTGVLLIHGFLANPCTTRPLGQRLAGEGFRVEVPLLPGHGTSHRDLATTRYADWVGAVERVLEHLLGACERVVLLGHAAGGTIALDVASRRVDDVAAVVVINPLLNPSPVLRSRRTALLGVVPFVPRHLMGMPTDDLALPGVEEHAYRFVPSRSARSLVRALGGVRAQLLDLTQPLLVIRSPQDHTVPPRDAIDVMELVGTGDLRELVCSRSYHVPQLDRDADEVEDAVVAFLHDLGRG